MNEYDLPIDIHATKLVDWLVSRKHCNKDWKSNLDIIRTKIRNALKDMPQNEEILQILANQNITYYTCKKIVEILKETEKDTKNIFGYYSSERMKEWQEILNMYETNGIYLVESAQNLVRNVTYEVPSLKKNINRLQQLHDEYTKKHHEYIKQSKHFKKEYFADSQRLGLKGEDIVQEINAILVEFPIFLSTRITNRLEQLKTCRDRYVTFLRFINNSDSTNDSLVLPLLVYLLNKGNTTYYEYETGEVPQVIQLNFELNNQIGTSKSNEEDQIDFGDEIDFGDQIDFCDKVDFGDQIDFGDNQAADCANFENSNETKLTDSSGKNEEKKATGLYALTLLEHPITRTNFINELSELTGFLQQRLLESRSEDSSLYSSQLQEIPELVDLFTESALSESLQLVQYFVDELTSEKTKMVYMILDSKKYVDTIIRKLNHKTSLSDKANSKANEMQLNAARCIKNIEKSKPQIPLLIQQSRELQKIVQSEISKRYKNRPVNIMGGAQTL